MASTEREILVDLSRSLGDPALEAAILGEGNTSIRVGDEILVKASGASLAAAEPGDFVAVGLAAALDLIGDEDAGDAEVDALFAEVAAREGRRPSVEALLHVVVYEATDARVVGHTHPTSVNALLCSTSAELLVAGSLFPDQIVVLGAHALLVPYVDPGVRLARHVRGMLLEHIQAHGEAPRAIYLRNHGMFAVGSSPAQVLGITQMAQKCAKTILGAASVGEVQFMPDAEVARIDSRPDEKYRRALLANEEEAR